ncbi:AP2-like ethylene-responsive transcription factor BBM2 [Zingiber officinale]|uniref:AP2-like ethylene-responsive transcription factor BBM2 n=1 Tax=Zingiber officinale TaxID=94328 RepID=UPI001C4D5FEF|nr:AP2-like ethylene-responsive transcription factor BBM2 [Zingiber officinale]
MASMNDWLAFSLSPQEVTNSSQIPHLISSLAAGVSGSSYVDDPPMGIPTIRNDASFGVLEAFHRPVHQNHDWNLKILDFKGAGPPSELSMLVGSSRSYRNHTGIHDDEEEPKLEDFLGGNNSFADHDQKAVLPDYMFPVQDASVVLAHDHGAGGLIHTVGSFSGSSSGSNNNSIGLSMIKTWLRNQPAGTVDRITDREMVAVAGESSSSAGNATNIAAYANTNAPQGLSLSMSTGTQSKSGSGAVLPLLPPVAMGGGESSCSNSKQKGAGIGQLDAQTGAVEAISRKPADTFGQRTSIYRGVTRHRWTGRYEAHLWDNSCRREGQTRKGRQVYLGGYDKEDKAARAYDLAALKYWGPATTTNFPIRDYEKELEEMKHMTRQELVASLRRKSSGFSRGASIYRGVTRHHQHGRWQARIGRVAGNKDLYLGTFSTQEEAAEAYDVAAIKFRGLNAVTNFDMSRYDVKSILENSTLAIGGGGAKRLKEAAAEDRAEARVHGHLIRAATADDHGRHLLAPGEHFDAAGFGWPTIAFRQPPGQVENSSPLALQYHPYAPPPQRAGWCKQEQEAAHGGHGLRQLHLGGAHNFFRQSSPANAVLHDLVTLEYSPLEPGTGLSNSAIYNAGGYQQGGFATPMAAMDHRGLDADDSSAYYLAQHLDTNNATWMPTSGQATDSRSVAGASFFRAWNNDG